MSSTLASANVTVVDSCISCDSTKGLYGVKLDPPDVILCRKCKQRMIEFDCTCGHRRFIPPDRMNKTKFNCSHLLPEVHACEQRFVRQDCPCCGFNYAAFVPEPSISQERVDNTADSRHDGASASLCMCFTCFKFLNTGMCSLCEQAGRQTFGLMAVTQSLELICKDCLKECECSRPARHESQTSGKGPRDHGGEKANRLDSKRTEQSLELPSTRLENAVSSRLDEMKQELLDLTRTMGKRPENGETSNFTIWKVVIATHKLIQSLPATFTKTQNDLNQFVKLKLEELKDQSNIRNEQTRLDELILDDNHNAPKALQSDSDEQTDSVDEIQEELAKLTESLAPLTELKQQACQALSIAQQSLPQIQKELQQIRAEFSKAGHEPRGIALTTDRVVVEQSQLGVPEDVPFPELYAKLAELKDGQQGALVEHKWIVRSLEEEVRKVTDRLDSLEGKLGQGSPKTAWFGKKDNRSEELAMTGPDDDLTAPQSSDHMARVIRDFEDFGGKLIREFGPGGKLLNFLKKQIPLLFDSIDLNLNSINSTEEVGHAVGARLLQSIRGWQNNAGVELIPHEDVTQTLIKYSQELHTIIGSENVHDPQQHMTVARVEKMGFRLVVSGLDTPIVLRRASVVVRDYRPPTSVSHPQEA